MPPPPTRAKVAETATQARVKRIYSLPPVYRPKGVLLVFIRNAW